uniref:mRNA decay factor PAT1 domain-containing protein n=1 Tax=Chrysolophus pictus TaxID=9089 RepID=A0A8C3LUS3_CHRPC
MAEGGEPVVSARPALPWAVRAAAGFALKPTGVPAAAPFSPQILEDYLLAEDAPLLEEMAEEDEELDLYNEMTFGLDRDSAEEDATKTLVPPERSPELLEPEEQSRVEEGQPPTEEQGELRDEGGMEPEAERVGSEEEEEEDEEQGVEEQEDEEEPNDLGDPAVMRAVQSKPTLESQDSAVLDSRIGSDWAEFGQEDMLAVDPMAWGSCPSSIPPHHMLEDKAILQVLERPPTATNVALDFLSSPVQRGYVGSPRHKRPDFRGMSPKSFPQHFLQQSAGYMSPGPFSPLSPNVGTPPRSLTMHFGPVSHSLDSSVFFSPSTSGQLNLSVPSHLTQLHPQHQRILTQRQQQGGTLQSVSPKKLWSPKADPCAGLMTCKEKDWVVKVEMIQLQSENLDDDYYYQTYYHRLEHKQAEEELLGGRNKQEPPKLVTPFIQKVETYNSVVRIAGSLGQVAVSTCYSPRRAIDAVHHALVEEAAGSHRLRALHRIERLFLQLLEVEEMQRKMSLATEEQEHKTQEVGRIYQALNIRACSSEEEAEDEFLQVLCVRKGKKLTARLLPHLAPEQAEKILLTITHH